MLTVCAGKTIKLISRSSWNDRIPFVLIFGIATSLDIFQDKLPRATLRRLRGESFDVSQVDVDEFFQAATAPDRSRALFLGAELYHAIIQPQKDNIQHVSVFISAVKVTISAQGHNCMLIF